MATVLVTGGTGLIGKALTRKLLGKGYDVIVLTRDVKNSREQEPGVRYALWNINKGTIDREAVAAADYIIHLAGAGVADKGWTKKRKQEIVRSRVESSKLIAESLMIPNRVKAVISASGIGWYGWDPSIPNPRPFVESDPPARDFLGETCRQWELALDPLRQLGKRVVYIRTGIALSNQGGAMQEFKKTLQWGIAPILGSGKQVLSWIHIDDLVGIYLAAIENESLNGAFNAVSPHPVTNKEFILALAKTRKRFFIPVRVPSFVLKLAVGEVSVEVLKSATVSSKKIEAIGFVFQYPGLSDAFQELINK